MEEQTRKPDPQEDEKNGNVLGKIFDSTFGAADGKQDLPDETYEKEPEENDE